MTETDISKVLIEGDYATIMGVKYKRVEEPKTPVEEAYKDWFEEVLIQIGIQPSSIPTLLRYQAHQHEYLNDD